MTSTCETRQRGDRRASDCVSGAEQSAHSAVANVGQDRPFIDGHGHRLSAAVLTNCSPEVRRALGVRPVEPRRGRAP